MRLYKPVKPGVLNQGFGSSPTYYAKFHDDFGRPLKGHDGLDFFAPHGIPVYAAHDGMARWMIDSHGGQGIMLRSIIPEADGTFGTTMYWHLIGNSEAQYRPPIACDGKEYSVKAGQLIGYADNTGAPYESSGDHLHFGFFFVNSAGVIQNHDNGFNGRIDPTPYFTEFFAQDLPKIVEKYSLVVSLLQTLLAHFSKK